MKLWILTCTYNEYNQYGDYFVTAWTSKPTAMQVQEILVREAIPATQDNIEHILTGGGRRSDAEDFWYNLDEQEEGQPHRWNEQGENLINPNAQKQ